MNVIQKFNRIQKLAQNLRYSKCNHFPQVEIRYSDEPEPPPIVCPICGKKIITFTIILERECNEKL